MLGAVVGHAEMLVYFKRHRCSQTVFLIRMISSIRSKARFIGAFFVFVMDENSEIYSLNMSLIFIVLLIDFIANRFDSPALHQSFMSKQNLKSIFKYLASTYRYIK